MPSYVGLKAIRWKKKKGRLYNGVGYDEARKRKRARKKKHESVETERGGKGTKSQLIYRVIC